MNEKQRHEIRENLDQVILHDTPYGESLWQMLIAMHPADIADFIEDLNKEDGQRLFGALPIELRKETFQELADSVKVYILEQLEDQEKVSLLHNLSADELADIFDQFSDEDLKKYLNLLHKNMRQKVLSLLQFEPESVGGIMTTDAISLMEDFTVEQSVKLLQRLRPSKDVHQQLFVTDRENILVGHINLEDLVLHSSDARIKLFTKKNELVARPEQDQEAIAKQMVHYGLMAVPVADDANVFLGVITSETLVDVLVEEAGEDVVRMASLPTMKFPYFEMSFIRLFFQRCYVLVALLIAESFSGTILRSYEELIKIGILYSFLPMLTSAGGNTGSQTSAVVIQGMATGEIGFFNMFRLLRREFVVSGAMALLLGAIAFVRSYYFAQGSHLESGAIAISISLIVFISAMLGSVIPFILRRLNVDPAFSAGPFLATLMDILGIVIYCQVVKFIFMYGR